jgi:hypothetical protein
MLGGNYPAQSIRVDATKANASANVIFQPAPGATVTLANSDLAIAGAHVEFHHLRMDQTGCANAQPAPPCPQLVIQTGAHDVLVDDIRASRFFITGAYNITITNSDFGPAYDFHGIIHADTAGNRPHDITLSNVSVHDHWNTDACKAQAGCISAHHQGCGPTINDAYNVLEDRMRFFNCQDLDQLVKPYRFPNQNITIQNSWFGPNNGYFSLDLTSVSATPNQGLHIRNNTFTKGVSVTAGIPYPNSDFTGNILPGIVCNLFTGGGWALSGNLKPDATSLCGAVPPAPDTIPPTLVNMPGDALVEATGPGGASVYYTAPSATDNPNPNPTVGCLPASGSTFPLGSGTVTCIATDASGNTSTGAFSVTVRDTTAPTVPGSPTPSDVTRTGVDLSWAASTDAVGVTGYDLWLNGTHASSTVRSRFTFAGLACGTAHLLTVAAHDAAGHQSQQSSAYVSTLPCLSTPPTPTPTPARRRLERPDRRLRPGQKRPCDGRLSALPTPGPASLGFSLGATTHDWSGALTTYAGG